MTDTLRSDTPHRVIPEPDPRYHNLSVGVDDAIVAARMAGVVDAERLVADAQHGVERLKQRLELSANAQKVGDGKLFSQNLASPTIKL